MALFSKKKKYKRGGYVGTPTVGTPIEMPLVNPGEIVLHRDGTVMIVNQDRTCSEVFVDHDTENRLAEFLCFEDTGSTITEHDMSCGLPGCTIRDSYRRDAHRVLMFLTKGDPDD